VWEQVRRELFRAAVEQRRWRVVKQWADHTLYLDQRWWALQEAYKHKQWSVMLLLADHGLNEIELM
jgi:protoheme ferro-lyase